MKRNKKIATSFKGVFIIMSASLLVVTVGIVALLAYIFNLTELLIIYLSPDLGWFVILIWIVSSIVVGLLCSFFFGKIIMKPVDEMVYAMTQLSEGVYDISVDLGNRNALKKLSDCLNILSKELKKNETLSNDFINNFSHELKTPLVSIVGLISLMKQPNFPENKRLEYLNIIEEEANRLASMTTNILNLSKLENQSIVSDKERYNISEQIRSCVLLLEKKWEKKNLEIDIAFDEYYVYGNVDMLKHVWLNLLDNAIKFAFEKSKIVINIEEDNKNVNISIENEGESLTKEEIELIFQKFYRTKKGEQKDGNGIGLSVVRKIIELHNGNINCECNGNVVKFKIRLAK